MKRYLNAALTYAVLAMAGGVFYREFTKLSGFDGTFSFTGAKTGRVLAVYHVGLNLTAVMLAVRGVTQVLGTELSSGVSAAISGMAGIGHILLGVSLVLLLLQIKRSLAEVKC